MKRTILMALAAALITSFSFAQNKGEVVPEKVEKAFHKKFPDVKKVRWEKENATVWEGEFKMNGTECSANFDQEGKWLETEMEIKKTDIPANVQRVLDEKYAGFKIEESEKTETMEGKFFEFEMEKGEKTIELRMTPDGKVVSEKVEEEDDDKD
ncbi:MAG: PepSY-like domain-containing protein [Saprospiraceae bacterium]|nr:PepSY-like domain-containing protein [Saprospiraceae bacterium]